MRMFVLMSVTNSIYRIREQPKTRRKQYRLFHFPSSYTVCSSKNPQSICPCFPGIVSNRTVAFSSRSIFRLLTCSLPMLYFPSNPCSFSFSNIRTAEYGASPSHWSTCCLYSSSFVGFGADSVYSGFCGDSAYSLAVRGSMWYFFLTLCSSFL